MIALVDSSTRIRCLPVQPFRPMAAAQGICVGVPSVSPLVQRELLRAMRERIPQTYANAWYELGVTVSQTQALVDRRVEIISAARAIKLARMIACEKNSVEVFSEAGVRILTELLRRMPLVVRQTIRRWPIGTRRQFVLSWASRMGHHFAGSVAHISVQKETGEARVTIRRGVFSESLETFSGAQEYYRSILQTLLQDAAFTPCRINPIEGPRLRLDQCRYQIVWEA